ncbi:caspase family protein [Pedobacter sp. PF22-3]|uniref:caspase family protein n=1 Tax=Pedobacter sp. PF22-3 TaxID=2994467 RepID=UPI0022456DA5|nr:caspase family protein [Pedobacter sp. PF22-3]MCX2492850.1 caspase family protein [Pedobacter sp. PF22-3]
MVYKALLFGVDNYNERQYRLSSCLNDVRDLKIVLEAGTEEYAFDVSTVNEDTLHHAFNKRLRSFFDERTSISLFYFSGHATNDQDPVMMLKNYSTDNPGVPFSDVIGAASRSKAMNTILILDCCYSGNLGNVIKSNTILDKGLIILTSSAETEESRCINGQRSSFTDLLIQALDGGAANERGIIDIASVFSYINKNDTLAQRPIFKCNVENFLPLKKLDTLQALSQTSVKIHNEVKSFSKNECVVQVVYQKEDYMKLLEEAIDDATNEILFTSSRIADENDELYGELQRKINIASKQFQVRNPKRRHIGIIPTESQGSLKGAIALRLEVPDLSLRFHPELTDLKFNFFIADKKKLIIRFKDNFERVNYSVSISRESIALLMRRYFYRLWSEAKTMTVWIDHYKKENENKLGEIGIELSRSHNYEEKAFLELLLRTDLNFYTLINNQNKLIKAQSDLKGIYDEKSKYLKVLGEVIKSRDTGAITLNGVQNVTHAIKSSIVDYTKYGMVFAFQYFLANYFKVRHTFMEPGINKRVEKISNVLDLGGGGGASMAAFVDYMLADNVLARMPTITIVDHSEAQINLCKRILQSDSINYINLKAIDFLKDNKQKFDLIISSNFLCEVSSKASTTQDSDRSVLLEEISKHLTSNGYLLIIEQLESKIYEFLLTSKWFECIAYKFENERYKIPLSALNELMEAPDSVDVNLNDFLKKNYTLRYGLYRARTNKPL